MCIRDRGYTLDEIFEGPLLEHGFISDESLEILERRDTIFTSDLISLIMDVEGIIAVNGFKITNYVDNRAINKDAVNCLQLYQSDTYQPKLTIDKSVYIAYSNDITLPLDADTIQTRFDEKKEALINQQTTVTYDELDIPCLLYTSPSPRDLSTSRMPSSA